MVPISRNPCPLVIVLVLAFAASAPAASEQLRVDPLKATDFVTDGAWSVWFLPGGTPNKIVRIAEVDFSTGELVVRVNGRVERLAKKSETWSPRRYQQDQHVGDRCEEVWANARVKARISYELVGKAYELLSYSGKITFSSNGQTRSIDVQGEFGS